MEALVAISWRVGASERDWPPKTCKILSEHVGQFCVKGKVFFADLLVFVCSYTNTFSS